MAAVLTLVTAVDRLSVTTGRVVDAWSQLEHVDRVEIGKRWPHLANALIDATHTQRARR